MCRPPSKPSTAYVFKAFHQNGKPKLVLAISGGQVMANVLEILPEIEQRADVKIVAVTSPQLYEELRRHNPKKAHEILSDDERRYVVTLHNGWRGFLHPFLLPGDYEQRAFGIDEFSRSGRPSEIYEDTGFDPAGLRRRLVEYLR